MYSLTIRNRNGIKCFYKNGVLHRDNGFPAMEFRRWYKEWWIDGKRHRTDGPAVEYINGVKEWWVEGDLHRDNGPAIESCDEKIWYQFGVKYEVEQYENGTKEWRDNLGFLDRPTLPAIEYSNGDYEYWCKGARHRSNGPAVVIGNKQYFFEFGEFQKCM